MNEEDSTDDMEKVAALVSEGQLSGFTPLSDSEEDESERAPRQLNKLRDFVGAYHRFKRFYFSHNCVYSENDFERRFRMPRRLFDRIEREIFGKGEFKLQKDATGKSGIHPTVRLISVLRIFAYGKAFDEVDELCELSEGEAGNSFNSFILQIPTLFSKEYLRPPNEADIKRMLGINAQRGFLGCVGSWDCQH